MPGFGIGRNIHEVVEQFGEPSYWTSNYTGSDGRYLFHHPNQSHFVFETGPGGTITSAMNLP